MNFWAHLYPNISLPAEIWAELSDFYYLILSTQEIIPYVTGERATKIMTSPEVVKAMCDDMVTEISEDFLVDNLQYLLDSAGVKYQEGRTPAYYLNLLEEILKKR